SCHDDMELARAAQLGVDFVVLGPVLATPSHADTSCLGWQRFSQLASDSGLPVFALGGLRRADLELAWTSGAHGVAMVRGAWEN
ncbi:MAG: thiamine phosphate synthase, partial [Burkholderiales bacterium]